jgi:hypothetical protein
MEAQTKNKLISSRELHKYVWMMVGVFVLIAATFPIALMRVSKEKKFAAYNFHLKSLTPEGKLPTASNKLATIQPVANNSSAQTINAGNTDKTLSAEANTPKRESMDRVIRWNALTLALFHHSRQKKIRNMAQTQWWERLLSINSSTQSVAQSL